MALGGQVTSVLFYLSIVPFSCYLSKARSDSIFFIVCNALHQCDQPDQAELRVFLLSLFYTEIFELLSSLISLFHCAVIPDLLLFS